MDDTGLVRHLEGGGDLPAVDLGLAQSEQRRDPRMADRGERSGFAFESRQAIWIGSELGRQQLDRHFAPELSVAGSIDDAHASLAELGEQLVQRPDLEAGAEPALGLGAQPGDLQAERCAVRSSFER